MKNMIDIGDLVSVDFYGAQETLCHEAVVIASPRATGDSWIFRDTASGQIHYVSEGCTISKKKARDDEKVSFRRANRTHYQESRSFLEAQ